MKATWMIPLLAIYFLVACQSESLNNTIATVQQEQTPSNIQNDRVLDYALSPDGKYLATYSYSGVYIYDINPMQKNTFLEFEDDNYDSDKILHSGAGAIAFSPNGEQLAISGKFPNNPITIWDIKSKEQIDSISGLPQETVVSEIEFSPNGESLFVRNMYFNAEHCEAGGEDRTTLHNIAENKVFFQANKCVRHPPLQFQFTENEQLFLYWGGMTEKYSVQFVDSNTGKLISENEHHMNEDGNFVGLSGDGTIHIIQRIFDDARKTYLLESQTNEVISTAEGEIVLLRDINSYVTQNFYYDRDREGYIETQWEYWEEGQHKCDYKNLKGNPKIKPSFNKEFFAMTGKEIQVWHISTCEIVFSLPLYDN